ncbi:MAG: sugar ABC transporter ATP-binding protein [Ferruginibacter sp.]
MESKKNIPGQLLYLKDVNKSFDGVPALKNVSLKVNTGEVHALMGENGAGKSTLMKIITGIFNLDSGHLFFNGTERFFKSPSDALSAGICMVHQELNYFPDMTVAENIFMNREPAICLGVFVNYRKMRLMAKEIFAKNNIDIDPGSLMKDRSAAEKQIIEIIKAISQDASLIIMDEPTSALSAKEINQLFSVIKNLKQKGIAIIYISHRMEEIFSICDTITILRDGQFIDSRPLNDFTNQTLIQAMIGRELKQVFPVKTNLPGEVVLEIKEISKKNHFDKISFVAHKGEILGITGLMGAGRTELLECIFGIHKKDSGGVFINNKKVNPRTPLNAIKNKISLVTEDRKQKGLFLDGPVRQNITLCSLRNYCRFGQLLNLKAEKSAVDAMISKLNIKVSSARQITRTLSGGNQQKVVLAKWLLTDPEILFLDEPTLGVDIGARAEIYKLINQLAENGKTIVMISSDNSEILGLCDRVLVMCEGRITADMKIGNCTQENILQAAMLFQTKPHN